MAWTTRLELNLPAVRSLAAEDNPYGPLPLEFIPLPLFLKRKAILTGFDATGEEGKPVRIATWSETRPLVREVLIGEAQAESAKAGLGALEKAVADELCLFAEDRLRSADAYGRLKGWAQSGATIQPQGVARAPEAPSQSTRRQARLLVETPKIQALLQELDGGFLVLAYVQAAAHAQTMVLLIRHDDSGARSRLVFPAGTARSYHAEVRLPSGIEFRKDIEIKAKPLVLADNQRPAGSEGTWRFDRQVDMVAVHAVSSRRDDVVTLRPDRSIRNASGGLGTSARAVACLTFLGLFLGLWLRHKGVMPVQGVVVPLVLSLPAAYALLVLRRPAAQANASLAGGPRVVLLLCAAITSAAAVDLSLRYPGGGVWPTLWGYGEAGTGWLFLTALALAVLAVSMLWRPW